MVTKEQNGTSKIRPKARLIRTIGDELISNDNVAIVELVKNSYDADAHHVKIIFNEPNTKNNGLIIIKDDGSGMDLNTVINNWLQVANNSKKHINKTKLGRKVLGEKGIGRFAASKLSKKIQLITKRADDNEVVINIDWDDFSDDNKFLDEYECKWEVRTPKLIKDHGTILILNELISVWDNSKFEELNMSLSRLISPFSPPDDFAIELQVPIEYEKFNGTILPPRTLNKPDYSIKGEMIEDGIALFEYMSKNNDKSLSLKEEILIGKDFKIPTCGPFKFEFRVWNRDNDSIKQLARETGSFVTGIKKDLNQAAGISIYRDGFRVLPYGEAKNDWLRLDIRRVQNPTRNLSNNQIVGYISISKEKNPLLIDQSNREGIIDSKEFSDLQNSILSLLTILEINRYKEKRQQTDEDKDIEYKGLFKKINFEPVIELINKKLPNDTEAKQIINKTTSEINEGFKEAQAVILRYRRLSTLGSLLDRVLHEGNNSLYKIDSEAKILQIEYNKGNITKDEFNQHITYIRNQRQIIANLFVALAPLSGGRQENPTNFIMEKAINEIFLIYKRDLNKYKIHTEIPTTETTIKYSESEFKQIIINLLINSIYWLSMIKDRDRLIKININENNDKIVLLFSDNGPGVKDEDIPFIFKPYFSRKSNGIGLGLTIVGEIVTENNGSFEYIEGPLEGANFKITIGDGNGS